MNCAKARELLLAADLAERAAPAVEAHLAACLECRAAQWRLERLSRDLPRLPVPASAPPAALLEKVLFGGALVRVAGPRPADRRQGGRQKLALTFALAASLAAFALGWWAWSGQQGGARPTPRQAYEERLRLRTPAGLSAGERVGRLTEMAEEMLVEAKGADAARLGGLAKEFDWLAADDLPSAARRVPAGERAAVLEEASRRLRRLESEAARLEADRVGAADVAKLRRIAAALRAADRHVRKLVEG